MEWFKNAYCIEGFFHPKGYCDKCEKKETKEWVEQQSKLIREGKRGLPKI